MFFTKENVIGICGETAEMFEKYSRNYDKLKGILDLGNAKAVWCKEWAEPFNPDYISEIDDCTMPVRKILKGVPKKKNGCTEHYYKDGEPMHSESMYSEPIYSAYWGEGEEPVCEKFYVHAEGRRTGLVYLRENKRLIEVWTEELNTEGNVEAVYIGRLLPYTKRGRNEYPENMPLDMEIRGRKYYYENNIITRAEAFGGYNSGKAFMWYDDRQYEGVGNILPMDCPPMNPQSLCEYRFNYSGGGFPETFTRRNYFYCKTSENTYKFKGSAAKRFEECGIGVFKIK